MHGGGYGFELWIGGGDGRVADAGEIGGDDGKFLSKLGHGGTPHEGGFGESVEEDEGGAVAGLEVVELDAVDGGEVGGDGRRRGVELGKRRERQGEEEVAEAHRWSPWGVWIAEDNPDRSDEQGASERMDAVSDEDSDSRGDGRG